MAAAQSQPETDRHRIAGGVRMAIAAHLIWGAMPLYLLMVASVPAAEYVAWRVLFTVPVCLAIMAARGTLGELARVASDRRAMLALIGCAATIGINWTIYVWAVQSGHVYAASLGFYILPLVMLLLGFAVLGERLTRLQWVASALAALGVGSLALGASEGLAVSVSLGVSFAVYGLLRKVVAAGPLTGLAVETLLLAPVAVAVIAWHAAGPAGISLGRDAVESWAIAMAGPITALPLILFSAAARRMPYTAMGFLQFLSPTIIFILGLTVFDEVLRPVQLLAFVTIWTAAGLFCWDLLRRRQPHRPVAAEPIPVDSAFRTGR